MRSARGPCKEFARDFSTRVEGQSHRVCLARGVSEAIPARIRRRIRRAGAGPASPDRAATKAFGGGNRLTTTATGRILRA